MKRRVAFQLIPLSVAGLMGSAQKALSHDTLPGKDLATDFTESLAFHYTEKVKEMLIWIRTTQLENLQAASAAIARTVKNGNQCWCSWDMGHSFEFDIFPNRNGYPEIFKMGYDPKKTKKGDLFLASIWHASQEDHEDLDKKDIFVIGGPAPWGGDAKRGPVTIFESIEDQRLKPYSDIWIETNITTLGAVINIPGSYPPLGPVSGIIGIVTFWMMMADACRILALDGKSVKVRGDEPRLSGKNITWEKIREPIMDNYFEQIMIKLESIGAEYGYIRKTAKMVVDSILSGGKVWCYSRYLNSLAVESTLRRGGLFLTQGVYDKDGELKIVMDNLKFEDTSKDIVIMGITKPDDEVDLRNLDKFRMMGMKVASIGPMSRSMKQPEGRTVPKESDIHIGRMIDTYGCYAIPGFDQKVCPATGALTMHIFWCVCMEIVEGIIQRTGNVPGIGLSGTIKGYRKLDDFMFMQYYERGY
ncbi:hypothetical protein ACFL47_05625 [Candidatus Latescibacterota bacterium]